MQTEQLDVARIAANLRRVVREDERPGSRRVEIAVDADEMKALCDAAERSEDLFRRAVELQVMRFKDVERAHAEGRAIRMLEDHLAAEKRHRTS